MGRIPSGCVAWLHRVQVILSCAIAAVRCPYAAAMNAGLHSMVTLRQATRIINGTVESDTTAKYSFFALPTHSRDSDVWLGCGASIISPTFGLTAAHCFGGGDNPCSNSRDIALWLGDLELSAGRVVPKRGGRSARVEATRICHPMFDGKCSHGHDIVLLRLSSKLPAWVTPVPVDLGFPAADAGDPMISIGYGYTETEADPTVIGGVSRDLRSAGLVMLDLSAQSCARVFAGGFGCSDEASESPAKNTDQQLCLGSPPSTFRDTCSGDSGSPLLSSSGVQVGIVSYGGGPGEKVSGPGRMCGDPAYPGVYSRVAAFASFIQEHVPEVLTS